MREGTSISIMDLGNLSNPADTLIKKVASASKRTVNFISCLDKSEATLFSKLCGYGCQIGTFVPIIYDDQQEIYKKT